MPVGWLLSISPFSISVVFLAIILVYAFKPYINLYRTGLPFPRPVYPFLGNAPTIYRHDFQGAQIKWRHLLGPCYAVAQGQTLIYAVSDPVLLEQILVRNFRSFINRRPLPPVNRLIQRSLFLSQSEEWKMARRVIAPTFSSHKIRSLMFPAIMRCAQTFVAHLTDLIDKPSGPSDIATIWAKDYFGCFTIDVIAATAFGLNINSYDDINNPFVKNARKAFDFEAVSPLFALLTIFPSLTKLLSCFNLHLIDPKSIKFFADVVKETIRERRKLNIERNDYLQLLIGSNEAYLSASNIANTQTLKGHNVIEGNPKFGKISKSSTSDFDQSWRKDCKHTEITESEENGQNSSPVNPAEFGLCEEDVIANAILFFLAGYETTATALSWISRMLAWYPEIQDRVREELHAKIRYRMDNTVSSSMSAMKDDAYRHLTYEDLTDLPYMDCVIKEILRLHAPPLIFDRVASEDITLDRGARSDSINKKGDVKAGIKHLQAQGKKLFIPKGTIIEIPVYALHRDKDLWPDPNTFNPNRFKNDRCKGVDYYKYQYMPFGYGPRNCVGQRFALLEMKICLAAILGAGIQFVPAPGDSCIDLTPENTKFRIAGINFPRKGISVGLTYTTDSLKN